MFATGYSSKMKESFFCIATFVEYLHVYNISIVFQSMVFLLLRLYLLSSLNPYVLLQVLYNKQYSKFTFTTCQYQ